MKKYIIETYSVKRRERPVVIKDTEFDSFEEAQEWGHKNFPRNPDYFKVKEIEK